MGQQQLLLIVLGVILVGVAVVLGIQYFSVGAEEGAKDELVAHTLTVGANAQQWFKKPVAMGGGGNSFTANGGFDAYFTAKLVKLHSSSNGTYTTVSTDSTVIITALPLPNAGFTFTNVKTTVTPNAMTTVIN